MSAERFDREEVESSLQYVAVVMSAISSPYEIFGTVRFRYTKRRNKAAESKEKDTHTERAYTRSHVTFID